MAIICEDLYNIYENLEYNFLYKNDLESIHILFNLYDIEDNIKNIHPKYISLTKIKRYLLRTLKDKEGIEYISLNLGQLIHEEVNRLELYIYIKGYKNGYTNKCLVDKLEKEALKDKDINDLFNKRYLFHFDIGDKVKSIREKMDLCIESTEKESEEIKNIIDEYSEKLIKPKVLNLNKNLDNQIMIKYSESGYNLDKSGSLLSLDELMYIYNSILKILYRECTKLYKDSFWYGLNDRVLLRYR